MSLNETLDRIARESAERVLKEQRSDIRDKVHVNAHIADLAERIFFQRMLKDINHGMSEPKIDELIDRSVTIATKLFDKLYK